jgi:Fic family protein
MNKALFDAKRLIAQIVTDVVNLEDINYTVPEVQTLLDGITVGGHKLQDELITLNQIHAWQFLFTSIEERSFKLKHNFLMQLHSLVGYKEALTWGVFRSGQVSISGTDYLPPKASELELLWDKLQVLITSKLSNSNNNIDVYHAAVLLFAEMARTQFFFDGNKRTARMMMSGILLSRGLPMINVPAKRKLEFNQVMINYYNCQDFELLFNFMWSCIPEYIRTEYSLMRANY